MPRLPEWEPVFRKTVADIVSEMSTSRGLVARDFEKFGISANTLSRIQHATHRVYMDRLVDLGRALGMTPFAFVEKVWRETERRLKELPPEEGIAHDDLADADRP